MNFLLTTDLTPASARMLRYVFELNRRFFARLEVLHVIDMPVATVDEEGVLLRDQDAIIRSVEQEVWSFLAENRGDYHFDTMVSVVMGELYRAIAERAKAWPADLIITGHPARGKSGFWTSTGTGKYLLTHPPVPVLSIPENASLPPSIRQVLICTDLAAAPPKHQIEFLSRYCEALQARPHLLHFRVHDEIDWKGEEEIKDIWKRTLGVSLTIVEHAGELSLTRLIGKYASEHDIGLLVVFPHKHHWMDRLFMGTETGKLFDQVEIPILSMPLHQETQGS